MGSLHLLEYVQLNSYLVTCLVSLFLLLVFNYTLGIILEFCVGLLPAFLQDHRHKLFLSRRCLDAEMGAVVECLLCIIRSWFNPSFKKIRQIALGLESDKGINHCLSRGGNFIF